MKVSGLSMMELLIVLAIIGILTMVALPNLTGVLSDARSVEAQSQLKFAYQLENQYHHKKARYSDDFYEIRFDVPKLTTQGGQANYEYSILEASSNTFLIQATAVVDFNGDGQMNVWTIDQEMNLKEVVRD